VPVEVYVEDQDTPPSTGGIFSVRRNKWLSRPVRFEAKRRDSAVAKLAKNWIKQIEAAIKSGEFEQMKKTLFRIRDARGAALNLHAGRPSGETTPENLAFKLIRRKGYIDRLNKAMDDVTDRQFSIESVELNEFFIPPVTYHNKLQPELWDGEVLKPEVREKLLEIAKAFKQFIGRDFKVTDVRFKGSMANYNYTKKSDIDVHLIAKVSPQMEEFIEAKRVAWKEKYKNINVYGYPVELGVDDPNKVHTSSAVYSLTYNRWIDKPVYKKPETDVKRADKLYKLWKQELKLAIRSGDIRTIKMVEQKIRDIRGKALPGHKNPERRRQMELSDENVAYKRLRDTGILDKIKEIYNNDRTAKLSLETQKSLLDRLFSF
jgi:predicted nucleotidyltransferase